MDEPTLSFPSSDDEGFIEALTQLRKAGVDVDLVTSESRDKVIRTATVRWRTHSDAARTLYGK